MTRCRRRVSSSAACVLFALLAGAARAESHPPQAGERARLTVDERFFRDPLGRAVILRGVNTRVAGLFDVTFGDGRAPLENVPELRREDCRRMAELGLRLVRLPLSWSGIEPQRDVFDDAYFERIDRALRCFRREGIYTLLDLHQDAYSKEIGEDGAPPWAIVPEPARRLGGPLGDSLGKRRMSAETRAAFDSFFADGDPHGLQAQFIEMLEHVARRYANDEWVVGIDLFNEPFTRPERLGPFNARAAGAVRAVAPELIVLFEPTGLWTLHGGEPVGDRRMPVTSTMYAPHLYDVVLFGSEQERIQLTRNDLEPAFARAAREARDWGRPWLVGEFGAGPRVANYEKYLTICYDLQDEYLVSSALWLWKEDSQGRWGLFDRENGAWVEREAMRNVVSRPHAVRIAGTPTRMHFSGNELRLAYQDAVRAPNVLFIPERFRADTIRCDGQVVAGQRRGPGLIEVRCGSSGTHEISVALQPELTRRGRVPSAKTR